MASYQGTRFYGTSPKISLQFLVLLIHQLALNIKKNKLQISCKIETNLHPIMAKQKRDKNVLSPKIILNSFGI